MTDTVQAHVARPKLLQLGITFKIKNRGFNVQNQKQTSRGPSQKFAEAS